MSSARISFRKLLALVFMRPRFGLFAQPCALPELLLE